ncbi:MAG: hypothetical protein E5W82_24135 [Mesorhizobium sp.]|nr:MAG: hypothetical protein E5W82_24135 [Mesorhizobium sp.]
MPPPLSCRTSPPLGPQGGRLDVTSDFRQSPTPEGRATAKLPISPVAGEMSGRTEGGVQAPTMKLSWE